ncbi:MAG TPA: DUF6714 family protein [Abditibacteriaceae bacterium]|jgi:hypothetical protein
MGYQKVRNKIQAAFHDVKLGGGISLRQSKVIDNYGRGVTKAEFAALPRLDITDDWAALSADTLEEYCCIPHLDAEGFRYYIPAYMLSVLLRYENSSMRAISTLKALRPQKGDSWDFYLMKYSLLNAKQRSAIAFFLKELPTCLPLDSEDREIVERALRDYWNQYL